jgi:hypothetical protein
MNFSPCVFVDLIGQWLAGVSPRFLGQLQARIRNSHSSKHGAEAKHIAKPPTSPELEAGYTSSPEATAAPPTGRTPGWKFHASCEFSPHMASPCSGATHKLWAEHRKIREQLAEAEAEAEAETEAKAEAEAVIASDNFLASFAFLRQLTIDATNKPDTAAAACREAMPVEYSPGMALGGPASDFMGTPKVDGQRQRVVICEGRMFLCDPSYSDWSIVQSEALAAQLCPSTFALGADLFVLDAEVIAQAQENETYSVGVLVFDCVIFRGQYLRAPLQNRFTLATQVCQALHRADTETPWVTFDSPGGDQVWFATKPYFAPHNIASGILSRVVSSPDSPGGAGGKFFDCFALPVAVPIDGIIMAPWRRPTLNTYKLKPPPPSVDLEVVCPAAGQDLAEPVQVLLFAALYDRKHQRARVPMGAALLDCDTPIHRQIRVCCVAAPHAVVVECEHRDGQWHFVRVRHDKSAPNHWRVCSSLLAKPAHGLRQLLLHFCK